MDLKGAWADYEKQTHQLGVLTASRLEEAFAGIEGTPYHASVDELISMLPHAEPGSMLADFARTLLGLDA